MKPELLWPAEAELGEGTCWSPSEQALYWVDIYGQRLHRWHAANGRRTSWDFDETVSAVAECVDGSGLVLSLRHSLVRFDPVRGTRDLLVRAADEPPGNRFNDGKCDAAGRFWAGSMDFACTAPSGSLYMLGTDGTLVRHALGFPVVNGPAWSTDRRTLWVNDTARGTVHAFDHDPESGSLSNGRPWLRFATGDGLPDGMTTDTEGTLWICHWGGACVTGHDPATGAERARLRLPTRQITNACFGGADGRTLFVTSARHELTPAQRDAEPLAGALFAFPMTVPGAPPARYGRA